MKVEKTKMQKVYNGLVYSLNKCPQTTSSTSKSPKTSRLNSRLFFRITKETLVAYSFDVLGLFAGFIVASQLNVFQLSPWAIAVYPTILSAKGVTGGLLCGRLSTALHLGTMHPKFSGNTKAFYRLLHSMVIITLAASILTSLVSMVFGSLFWAITPASYVEILTVVVATMALGLIITLITTKVSFMSFKKGLDPDVIVYPIMSTAADIIITLFYIMTLSIFFLQDLFGKGIIAIISSSIAAYGLYILRRHFHEEEFKKSIKEALITLLFVAFIVNITGTVLKRISIMVENRREVYTVYPALIDLVGDVGSVVGSTSTTKLALGLLKPSFHSIKNQAIPIFAAWTSSVTIFVLLSGLSLAMNGMLTLMSFLGFTLLLLIANIIAVATIILVSYATSILTFQKGLDPDNFVIPIESSFADSLTSIALLISLLLLG